MSLTNNDQLMLIRDILFAHQNDRTARTSEYEQLYRSANALITKGANPELNGILTAIKSYGEQGLTSKAEDTQSLMHEPEINNWIQSLG